jgi:surfactin synthase thioesterase subunit
MYNILCFSFAGGNSYSYNVLRKHLSPDIDLVTLDYPGRSRRFSEGLITDINALVENMYGSVKNVLDGPYSIYGHSMGGLMAYKMAHHLMSKGDRLPDGLFITGCRAPSTAHRGRRLHDLPLDQLIRELKVMQGIPGEVLSDRDFMNSFLPILRADFAAIASYVHEPKTLLNIPIKVMTGLSEDISKEDAQAWQEVTTHQLDFRQLEGGHFFIFDHPAIIAQELLLCKHQWTKMHTVIAKL